MVMKKDLRTRLVSFFGSRGMEAVLYYPLQLLCVPTVWAQVTEEDLDTVELFKTFPPTIEGKCEQQNIRLNIKQPYKLTRSRGYVPSQLPCDTKGVYLDILLLNLMPVSFIKIKTVSSI